MLAPLAVTWTEAAPGIAGVVFGSLLLSGLVWQTAKTIRPRAAGAREDSYRQLAERATDAQERTAAARSKCTDELATLRTHVLREVE